MIEMFLSILLYCNLDECKMTQMFHELPKREDNYITYEIKSKEICYIVTETEVNNIEHTSKIKIEDCPISL